MSGEMHLKDGPKMQPEKVPILSIPRSYSNPLSGNRYFHPVPGFFVTDCEAVAQNVLMNSSKPMDPRQMYFVKAGPRENVVFQSEEVRVAIVTCGGLCPGMNTVIRELVIALWEQYNVRYIRGIQAGYRGFFSSEHVTLNPKIVHHWHKQGGTRLGTSRGGFNLEKIVGSIEEHGYTIAFLIGGDGTLRGACDIFTEVNRRGLKTSIACIPKTVDNDVGIIDRSFGLDTAVEAAQAAIDAAHVEAESTPNGVGLVKVMGRYAGHIAVHATLSSRDVDCCLIPEVKFYLHGKGGLLEFMEQRLEDNGHCVVLMAEGAGQDLLMAEMNERDESGNARLGDIGLWVKNEVLNWWKQKHPDKLFTVKYIDPTYMVRAVPSNATDTQYCTLLAHSAVHGAMAGFTGFVTGPVNGNYCYIPLERVVRTKNPVDVHNPTWAWVRSVNSQPDFVHDDDDGCT